MFLLHVAYKWFLSRTPICIQCSLNVLIQKQCAVQGNSCSRWISENEMHLLGLLFTSYIYSSKQTVEESAALRHEIALFTWIFTVGVYANVISRLHCLQLYLRIEMHTQLANGTFPTSLAALLFLL